MSFSKTKLMKISGKRKQIPLKELEEQRLSEYRALCTRQERKVFNHLVKKQSVGSSVIDMTTTLFISDPRGCISHMRSKGIPICDAWMETSDGVRFKNYWIKLPDFF